MGQCIRIFCFEVIEHSLFGKNSISLSRLSFLHLVFEGIRPKLARSRQAFPSSSRKADVTQTFARKITKSVTLGYLTSNLKVQGPK